MHALRVLEYGSLLERLADQCQTQLGALSANDLQPCFDEVGVWAMQTETREAYELLGRDSMPSLGRVLDLRDPLFRASKGAVVGGEELFRIGELLGALRNAKVFLRAKSSTAPALWSYAELFPEAPRLEAALLDSFESNGDVKDGASPTLASLRKRKQQAASRIIERIQSYVSGKTREYLSDPLYTVRDGRYVVPVKSEHRGKIRGLIHDTSGTGQTVYVEPEDVLKLGNDLREIEGQEREEVQRILAELSEKVGGVADEAIPAIERAAELDLVMAKARLGYEMEAIPPVPGPVASLKLDGARHPMLDRSTVVPVTLELGRDFIGLLITGPNTGGKTVAIKCAGLMVLMAQSGMLLPARDAQMGVFSQVWADIGDEQSIAQSLSTFSGHIKNIAEALKKIQPNALVLFDELGAGTDPAEGAALARSVLQAFKEKGARILASTHYGELKAFAYSEPGFLNAAMEFDSKSLRPTYRLMMGAPGASHAMKIAERYGIPGEVIEGAKVALGEQQRDVADMMEKLDQAQKLARSAQAEADRRAHELRLAEEKAAIKLAEADEIRRKANERATESIEDTLREIRLQAAEIFDELKRSGGSQQAIEKARADVKALQSIGAAETERFRPQTRTNPNQSESNRPKLERGATVQVEGYGKGTLLEDPAGKQVQVQIGALKMRVDVSKVRPEAPLPSSGGRGRGMEGNARKAGQDLNFSKAATASTEISLRGMRAEDAYADLERFIDDAVLGGVHQVRIVHGKGEGILRKMVADYLRRRKEVAEYRMGEPGEGGDGVTVAVMK